MGPKNWDFFFHRGWFCSCVWLSLSLSLSEPRPSPPAPVLCCESVNLSWGIKDLYFSRSRKWASHMDMCCQKREKRGRTTELWRCVWWFIWYRRYWLKYVGLIEIESSKIVFSPQLKFYSFQTHGGRLGILCPSYVQM